MEVQKNVWCVLVKVKLAEIERWRTKIRDHGVLSLSPFPQNFFLVSYERKQTKIDNISPNIKLQFYPGIHG